MRYLILSFMLVCFVFQVNTSAAQEETDDLQTVIDRIIPLMEAAADYTGFVSIINNLTERSSIISVPFLNFETQSITNLAYSSVRAISLGGDSPSGTAFSTIDVFDAIDDFITEYRLTAEVRYLDDIIYLRTEISDEELEAELALGNEWRTITDAQQLRDLQLTEFTNLFASSEEGGGTLDIVLQIVEVASSVTLGEAEIRGEIYETITFAFDGTAFLSFSEQLVDFALDDSAFGQVLATQITETAGDVFLFTLFINSNGQIAGRELEVELDITIDGASIDPELAGGTVSSRTYLFQQEILTDINRPIAPVEAPSNE